MNLPALTMTTDMGANVKSEPDRAALSREVGSTDGLGIAPGKERDAQT